LLSLSHKFKLMQKTILIVDDDPDDVQLFCEAIAEINKTFHCFFAENGEEALQRLKAAIVKPDFIFLDLNMPRMSGTQCLMQLKNNPQFANIPVIIYSTSKIKKDVEESLRLGAISFITKPNKFEHLVKAISDILAGKWEMADAGGGWR
jgi:CheY-like chemotaxis protein